MEQELITNLGAVFAAFSTGSKLAPATIWMRAAKDARFMDRIAGGAGFTVKTYDRVLAWFSENWPEGIDWPVDVARPAPAHLQEIAHSIAAVSTEAAR